MIRTEDIIALCRPKISLGAAASAGAAALLAGGWKPAVLATVCTAVVVLASGASALNQVQERDIDGRMERTRRRPLPTGALRPGSALVAAALLCFAGLALLAAYVPGPAFWIGLFALLWYNGIYTLLKRRTAFAALPGALVGALPPAMGWAAAGGTVTDPRIFAVCAMILLWQIPHFWLLALRYGKEYEQAGLPTPAALLSGHRLGRVTFSSLAAVAVAGLSLPLYGVASPVLSALFLLPAGLCLIGTGAGLLRRDPVPAIYIRSFRTTNWYLVSFTVLLSLQGLSGGQ